MIAAFRNAFFIATVAIPFVSALTDSASAQVVPAIADLRWLTGSWRVVEGDRITEEHWTEAATNVILAVGRTIAGDRVVFFEFLRIEARPDGVFYVAQPRGGAATEFRLTSWDGRTLVFENPEHDFPKRISYTRVSADSVTARADGGRGVERGAVTFAYVRARR